MVNPNAANPSHMVPMNTVSYHADTGGCGHYRMLFPAWMSQAIRRDIRVVESQKLIPIEQFYADVRMVRIQRHISDAQMRFVLGFLKPLSMKYGFWLGYEIDDVVGKEDIPLYNKGWDAFQDTKLMQNMATIMQSCDFITVTTEELKNYYVKKFGVQKHNVCVIPNYLPRWWMGSIYDEGRIAEKYDNISEKPKIIFVSSTTHFDIYNRNGGIDDFTHINDLVKDTINKYEWIFVGGIPQQLVQEYKDGKIKYISGFDILNYPRIITEIKPDLMVAPLIDNTFNRCKSNIKFIESSAMGIPCICQDLSPYKGYTDLLFRNKNDLQNQIDFVLSSKKQYMDIVKHNRNIIDFGDKHSPKGWWLESNIDKWLKIYTIAQKTLEVDLRIFDEKQIESPAQNQTTGIKEIKFEV